MEFKEQIDATVAKLREARMAGNKDVYHVDEVAEARLRQILDEFAHSLKSEPVAEEPAKEAL